MKIWLQFSSVHKAPLDGMKYIFDIYTSFEYKRTGTIFGHKKVGEALKLFLRAKETIQEEGESIYAYNKHQHK
jgi:hypothetical protein